MQRIAIVSDIHYAGPGEQARGDDYDFASAPPSLARTLVRLHRHYIWLRHPFAHNHLLDDFIRAVPHADLIVANGDFSCDSACVGLSDDAAFESAQLCLDRLRAAFGPRLLTIMGDHELGKISLLGERGGVRRLGYDRSTRELGIPRFWRREIGRHVLLGVTSSVIALPVFQPDALAEEWAGWECLRAEHMAEIRAAFAALAPDQRVILFCHDPTALPLLWQEPEVQRRANQIERTIIGHLHTRLVFHQSRWLAGIPATRRFGVALHRMTTALNRAQLWRPFKVELCPSISGCELLKDGGFLTLDVDATGDKPPRIRLHSLSRRRVRV